MQPLPFIPTPAHDRRPIRRVGRRVKEGIADIMVAAGKVPILNRLGYKIYGAVSRPDDDDPDLANLGQLSPNLLRGAQPSVRGYTMLRGRGIQTIMNLRPEYQQENSIVDGLGMKYFYLGLPAIGPPAMQQTLQFLRLVTDPANGTVFFHCEHGADRTGVMAAAYRIAAQGWTAWQALAEMYRYGFHEGFQDNKIDFVNEFAGYWSTLPAALRSQILHRPLNVRA